MLGRLLFALVLPACGRVGFESKASDGLIDTISCIAVDHDEDGDSIDDACDVCPQVEDVDQTDRDGDRVGDACDPHPDEPRDQIVFFDPFLSQQPQWAFPGLAPVYADDAIVVDTRNGQFRADLSDAPVDDTYSVSMTLGAGRAGQRQVALYALEDNTRLYFCDLDQDDGDSFFAITSTVDGVVFDGIATTPGAPVENGRLAMTMQHTPTEIVCATDWPVDDGELRGAIPPGITPVGASVSVIGLDVTIESFVHIHSN